MYASDFKLPKLVVKRLSVNGTKSRLTSSLLQQPSIGKSSSFVKQLPQIEAKAIPFHGRMSDCNVSQLFVANDVTADKPLQFVSTAPRMSSRIKSCKPFMRTPTGSIRSDSYGQFGLVCEGKSSLLNSSKSGVVSSTKQPSQYIQDHSDDEWIVDDNRLSLSPDSDYVYSPVPLLNLPTNINDFSANNEHCSIVNLNILLPDPKPSHCNRIEGERFGHPIKTNHQLKRDKAETITKKTSIINKLKFDFTDDFTSSSNTNPFNGKHSNITKESSTEKTTMAIRQSSPRKKLQSIPINIINEVDVIQFSNRKILRDPLILTPRRKTHGPHNGKIPVSKGVLGGKNKQQTDPSIDCSTATIQFPPVEAFSKKVNTRAKTGRFRKRPEKVTDDDDSHWKQIPPPPTPSHISSMLQITSRMSRQQNNCETFEAANCFKLQPPTCTTYNSAAAPSPMVDGNRKTKQSAHKYRKPSTKGPCYNKSSASGNEVSAEKFITISSVKIHKTVVNNEESPREQLFVKKPQVSYKTNEEFSYSDVSASEDDALIKQKVVKLKGQEYGTIRKEKRNDSRVFNNKHPKTTKRSRVPQ